MNKIIIFYLLCFMLFGANPYIDKLELMTEEYPPLNFTQNGKITGLAVEILEEVLKEANSSLTTNDIEIMPWSRAYNLAKTGKNKLIFSMTVTPEREKLFKFVGPFYKTKISAIGKKDKFIKIKNIEDLKKYRIGVVHLDIGEVLLLERGIPADNFEYVIYPKQNALKLSQDRINLWIYDETVASYVFKEQGLNYNNYESVFTLKEGYVSFALSKDVSDETVKTLQKALDKVMASKKYEEIIQKYK